MEPMKNANPFAYLSRFYGSGQSPILHSRIYPFLQTSGESKEEQDRNLYTCIKILAEFKLAFDQACM